MVTIEKIASVIPSEGVIQLRMECGMLSASHVSNGVKIVKFLRDFDDLDAYWYVEIDGKFFNESVALMPKKTKVSSIRIEKDMLFLNGGEANAQISCKKLEEEMDAPCNGCHINISKKDWKSVRRAAELAAQNTAPKEKYPASIGVLLQSSSKNASALGGSFTELTTVFGIHHFQVEESSKFTAVIPPQAILAIEDDEVLVQIYGDKFAIKSPDVEVYGDLIQDEYPPLTDIKIADEGEIAINAQELKKCIDKIPANAGEQVTLTKNEGVLVIKIGDTVVSEIKAKNFKPDPKTAQVTLLLAAFLDLLKILGAAKVAQIFFPVIAGEQFFRLVLQGVGAAYIGSYIASTLSEKKPKEGGQTGALKAKPVITETPPPPKPETAEEANKLAKEKLHEARKALEEVKTKKSASKPDIVEMEQSISASEKALKTKKTAKQATIEVDKTFASAKDALAALKQNHSEIVSEISEMEATTTTALLTSIEEVDEVYEIVLTLHTVKQRAIALALNLKTWTLTIR